MATDQQLADLLSIWRETISEIVQDFGRWGLVASGRRKLTLPDVPGIELGAGSAS